MAVPESAKHPQIKSGAYAQHSTMFKNATYQHHAKANGAAK